MGRTGFRKIMVAIFIILIAMAIVPANSYADQFSASATVLDGNNVWCLTGNGWEPGGDYQYSTTMPIASASMPNRPDPCSTGYSAMAYANMLTGELRVSASNTDIIYNINASASMVDTFYYTGSLDGATMTMHVTGTMSGHVDEFEAGLHQMAYADHAVFQNGSNASGSQLLNFDLTLPLWEDPYIKGKIPIAAYIETRVYQGGSSDFSHTATISLNLPNVTSWNSASGYFLVGEPTPAVPEPSALVLLGSGLCAALLKLRPRGDT